MPLPEIKIVTVDDCFQVLTENIKKNEIIISDYDDIIEMVLGMMRNGICFNFDKNLLRGFLEDIVYMCAPNDDANKSRIVNMLEESDDEDEDEDDEDDSNPNQMAQMMQMLMMGGGMPQQQKSDEESTVTVEEGSEPEPE